MAMTTMLPRRRLPPPWRALARWTLFALLLHLVWEVAHLPLYTLWREPDGLRIASYLLHCLLGDVLLADFSFLVVAAVWRSLRWPLDHPWLGGGMMLAVGLGFTAWSEWNSVYVRGAWAYTPAMPLVGGIGLTPLLQWIGVPVLMLLLYRRHLRRESARFSPDQARVDEQPR